MANSIQLSSPAIPPEALQYAVKQSFVYIGILPFQLFIKEEKSMNSKYRDRWLLVSRQWIYHSRFAPVLYPLHDWSPTSDIVGNKSLSKILFLN